MERLFQHPWRRWGRAMMVLAALATGVRVWIAPPTWVTPVYAQIPDSGLQRKELLDEARRTNQLLIEMRQLLKEHTFNVRIQGADKPSPPASKTGDGGL